MSKELEALEQIKASHFQAHIESENIGDFDIWFEEYYNLLRKALTPPTADDICEELEEYFYRCVGKACPCLKYEKDTKKFVYIDGLTEDVYELVTLEKHGYIHFGTSLPPHLVEMIGKFYKGKMKE